MLPFTSVFYISLPSGAFAERARDCRATLQSDCRAFSNEYCEILERLLNDSPFIAVRLPSDGRAILLSDCQGHSTDYREIVKRLLIAKRLASDGRAIVERLLRDCRTIAIDCRAIAERLPLIAE